MAGYGEAITENDKVNIVSRFLLHAPPGEFNEVFNDVRTLLSDDTLLKDRLSGSFAQYNKDQFTPVRVDGAELAVVISEHNDLGRHRFFDPRSKRSFHFDHLRKEAKDVQQQDFDTKAESWRSAFEAHFSNYVDNYYKHGVCSIFAKLEGGVVTIVACIEDHQFQPKNFWNGRWRAQWSLSFTPGSQQTAELRGIVKVQVHYYEDGNVQLVSSKEIKEDISISNENDTAKDVVAFVLEAENDYQTGVSENYSTMSETTFKALRRQLPLTRTKIDWGKITGYRIGTEIGKGEMK